MHVLERHTRFKIRIQWEEKGTVVTEREVKENSRQSRRGETGSTAACALHSVLASMFAPLSAPAFFDLLSWNLQLFLRLFNDFLRLPVITSYNSSRYPMYIFNHRYILLLHYLTIDWLSFSYFSNTSPSLRHPLGANNRTAIMQANEWLIIPRAG